MSPDSTPATAVRCIDCGMDGTHRVCNKCLGARLSCIAAGLSDIRESLGRLINEESWEADAMRAVDGA